MNNEKIQLLLSRYRSARDSRPQTGESSMTADFRISETETTLPTPLSVPASTSTVENQPSSQSMTCCPSDNTLENQPVAKLAKPESSGKPPIPPHSSENNVQCHPTPLKSDAQSNPLQPSNLSTDFSTPRFRRVPLRNLSSSRSLSSSLSSHDSSSTSSSIKAASISAVKPYSTYSVPESKNKENLVSVHAPEPQPSASELSKMAALLEEKTRALAELKLSSKKNEEKLKEENAELKKENEYIVAQYKVLQEKLSQHISIDGEGSVQTQLGQKVLIGGKQYNVQKDAIGKGGSCRVFSGTDCADNTSVAVKVVNLNKLPDKAVGVLQEEIALLHALKEEENIINLLNDEMRPSKSQLLIVLEFGESDLNDYLKKQKPLIKCDKLTSYYGVMAMWHQMLSAVHSIHKHHIIHKDLKPQNFILVKGKLKLIDFGISERIQADVTSMVINQPEGTPNYIAPELLGATFGSAACNRLGYCSDVYSLGCILYKMCFGVTPYQHIDKMQMKYYAITSPEPIKIPTLPHQDLVQIMTACLSKDRQKRPTIIQLMGFKGTENMD